MNTSKLFRNLGMKYTQYLIFGNLFVNRIYFKENNFSVVLLSFLDLARTVVLLGLAALLLPFALTLDMGRLLYTNQIRYACKAKYHDFVYGIRKNTINLVNRSGRFAYLIIRKTDSLMHLKL